MIQAAQVHSALRHVYTAISAGGAVAIALGLSQGDATAIGVAVQQIGDGIAGIVAGVCTLVPIISGVYAAISASRKSRMTALNADPEIKKVETRPGTEAAAEAASIPGNKVS